MSGLPTWLQLLLVLVALLWGVSVAFLVWVAFTSPKRRMRVQYILARAHFFKGFELDRIDAPMMEPQRLQFMAIIKILRMVVSTIAFINFITAMVLLLLGAWLLSFDTSVGILLQVLVLVVAPLLLLLSLYSLALFILLHLSYRRLLNSELLSEENRAEA